MRCGAQIRDQTHGTDGRATVREIDRLRARCCYHVTERDATIRNRAGTERNGVQISEYVRQLSRRQWLLLIVVPLVVGAVTAGLLSSREQERSSKAVVLVHPDISTFGSNVAYVTAFQAALSTDVVVNDVSKRTGVSASNLRAGLSASPTEQNSLSFDVTYRGSQPASVVGQVPTLATKDAFALLLAPTHSDAVQRLDVAQKQVDSAAKALQDFSTANNTWDPSAEYQAQLNQLAQLQVAAARDGATAATTDFPAIVSTQAELKRMGPLVTQYQQLLDKSSAAIQVRNAASNQLAGVEQQQSVLNGSGAIVAGKVTTPSGGRTVAATAIGAALLALVAMVGILSLAGRTKTPPRRDQRNPARNPDETDRALEVLTASGDAETREHAPATPS